MARKVFISVLGTGYYNKTNYYWQNKANFIKTRFIQEATIKLLYKDWNEKDKAYFFLTDDARKTNWNDPAQMNDRRVRDGERDTYKGLEKRIIESGIKYSYEAKRIPDGNNEQEIWEIFEEVYGVFEEEDEVYFDITHAFRSIPMLVMVLINYAKFLKKITVKSITYGNWEGREKEHNFAPIIDLVAFSELQDWTSAAASFIKTGNAYDIAELIADDNLNVLFEKFTDIHFVVRGKEIYKGEIQQSLAEKLANYKGQSIKPFFYINQEIFNKVKDYNDDLMNNAIISIKYCIDHNLIQQGFTLLEETLITFVLLKIDYDWEFQLYRDIASSCLKISKKEQFDRSIYEARLLNDVENGRIQMSEKSRLLEDLNKIIDRVFDLSFRKKIFNTMLSVSHGSRNDINHAGIREKPREAEDFKKSLMKHYNTFKNIVYKTQ